MNAPQLYPHVFGTLLALAAAAGTVLYDCHVSIQDRLKRVPLPIYSTPQAIILAVACGAVAAIAFSFTDGKGDTLIDSVLGLKQPNPYLRGLCVGLTVLVLIRSKLSSIKGAEIGGELAYNSGRVWVMQALNQRWRTFKSHFYERNKAKAFLMLDYEDQVIFNVREEIKIRPEDYRVFVESQIKNVQQSKPKVAFDATRLDWQTYYRTLTNLALDYAGATVFKGWSQLS
jgi:hypothetical protein